MRSQFQPSRRRIVATTAPEIDETYDLRGVNLSTPDAIMPTGESPFTINSRMYARNEDETRVANRTRQGASHLSTPVGEAANIQNIVTSAGDLTFSVSHSLAIPFTPTATKALTRLEPEVKKLTGATGHIIVEIYTDVGGKPGLMIAQGSILSSGVTTSFQYLPAYFLDAPTLTNGTQYWQVYYIQDNGSGQYALNKTATITVSGLSSDNNGGTWAAFTGSARFKTYLSTVGGVKGFHLRYPSSLINKRILIAHTTTIQSIERVTGTPTSIATGLNVATDVVRFEQVDDKSIWVTGFDPASWWDGTTTSVIANVPSSAPTHVIAWQNRLFFVTGPTRVDFSDLSDFETYQSVNFFYVPTPLSPDHIAGWIVFQDNLTIFTHETKHIILGSDISTFTRKEAVGTKGAVSQEAIVADRNYIYFMADDKQIYRFNGVSDELLSDKIQPEFQSIDDTSKVRLHLYRNQLRVYYPKGSSTVNNAMALLDLELKGKDAPYGQWFLDTDHQVVGSAELYLDQNQLIEFSSVVGRIYYGETQFSDLGKMLDWKFWTNYKPYGSSTAKKRIKRFRPIIRTVGSDYNMRVGKDVDFDDSPDMRDYLVASGGSKWDSGVKYDSGVTYGTSKQISNAAGMSGRGEHIQYRFERKGVETPVEVYGYTSQYKIGKPK